jgi:alpha-beta hydrolase superfamily lysophospholipase
MMRFIVLFSLALLVACAPTRQTYRAVSAEESRFNGDLFFLADETALPYRVWKPSANPKAVVIALHGFNDYSRAFESTGKHLSKRGIAVYAYDQRGFGAAPHTGIWAGEENLVNDLAYFVKAVSKRHPSAPVYILGESMGGAVAITALADPAFPKVKGVILVAPAVWGEDTMSPVYRATLWLAAHTIPSYEMTGSDLKILASNNIPMLRRMSRDPLIIKKTRVDAIYGIVNLMDSAYRDVPQVQVPVMLLYGAEDQVIPKDPIEQALGRFSAPVRYVHYPESYHMMLRDIQGDTVLADISSWIANPKAKLPSGVEKQKEIKLEKAKN